MHDVSPNFMRGTSLLLIAFISMYSVNVRFFLTLAVWFCAFAAFSIILSKRLVELSDIHTASESTISGQIVDTITNVSNVRIFVRAIFEIMRLDKFLNDTKDKYQQKQLFLVKLNVGQGMLIAIMLAGMLYFLIELYGRHLITVGDFALVLGLSMEVGHIAWFTMSKVDEYLSRPLIYTTPKIVAISLFSKIRSLNASINFLAVS